MKVFFFSILILVTSMKILITGSSGGIGFEVGKRLISEGHFVYFTVHRNEQIKPLVNHLKKLNLLTCASVFKLDISKKHDRNLILNLDVDCLICNAAIGCGGSILDIPIKSIETNYKINVFSNIELIQIYCQELLLNNKKGKIIVMSSLAGIIPIPFLGSYCATKSSLITLVTCLKKEVEKLTKDIKIKLIEPGIYNTGFNDVMIENRNSSIFFSKLEPELTIRCKKLFNFLGHNSLNSIVNKITKAVNSNSNKLLYSAPLFQKLFSRFYAFFR